jgi:outer membrane protein assembly factor BamB
LLQTYRGSSRFLADANIVDGVVIGGDGDGLLRFWDATSGARLWTFKAHSSAVVWVHVDAGDLVTRGINGELARWRFQKLDQVMEACAANRACADAPR